MVVIMSSEVHLGVVAYEKINTNSKDLSIMIVIFYHQAAFEVMSILAVVTNCALIGMAANSAHWLPEMTPVNAVLLFVAIEVGDVTIAVSLRQQFLTSEVYTFSSF